MDITKWYAEFIEALRDQLKSLNDIGGGLAANVVIPPKLTLDDLINEPVGVVRELLSISKVEEKKLRDEKKRQQSEERDRKRMQQEQRRNK